MKGLCHKCLTSDVVIKIFGGDIICKNRLEELKK